MDLQKENEKNKDSILKYEDKLVKIKDQRDKFKAI
jgi:hypothetical protein